MNLVVVVISVANHAIPADTLTQVVGEVRDLRQLKDFEVGLVPVGRPFPRLRFLLGLSVGALLVIVVLYWGDPCFSFNLLYGSVHIVFY